MNFRHMRSLFELNSVVFCMLIAIYAFFNVEKLEIRSIIWAKISVNNTGNKCELNEIKASGK